MKKFLAILVCIAVAVSFGTLPVTAAEFSFEAKSVILMEAETGRILYEKDADIPLPPASVTKIMTILLIMEAIDAGKIMLTDKVSISEHAAGMGGSQVYLEPGEQMTVDELLKCVVVASANDAAAALAEYCAGSEEAFVKNMNQRANELGMNNTHFENTNGLDDTTESHLTSARDIAIMSCELLKHEKIFDYTKIWMDTIRNGSFGLTNTNRLIRFYKGANGLKTGSTQKAGFCISATAKRDGMQLVAVIMASPTRDDRNATATKLLDYGFANFAFYEDIPDNESVNVSGSTKQSISVCPKEPFRYLTPKDAKGKIERRVELPEKIAAPVHLGDTVGRAVYYLNGEKIGSVDLLAEQSAKRMGFADLFKIALKKLAIF